MSESEYSEVVYISTVEELLAVDGHRDGYYELKNDLDLIGIEWSTLYLTNATFNGGGHTITGMSITKEPGTKTFTRTFNEPWTDKNGVKHTESWTETWTEEIHDLGFFTGYGNYAYDLNLSGASIDVTLTDMTWAISALSERLTRTIAR